ncbi:MAG: FtsX-like permease family protein [Rikenellaceae bacterium]|nr:FtsX-like permease family protein [Rikenellaceae bacterium]
MFLCIQMGMIDLEYFFAKRLAAEKGGRTNSVMVRVATLSVAIGLAVMIISLGIIFGFKKDIADNLTGFMSHVQIKHYNDYNPIEAQPISSEQPFLEDIQKLPHFHSINRYALKAGIIKGGEVIDGILLKGVGSEYDWSFFKKNLVEGEVPVVSDSIRSKDALISQRLASDMRLNLGDRMELMFLQDPVRRDIFKVAGIYKTELTDIDEIMILTDIRNVQRLNEWSPTEISGFEAAADDFNRIESFGIDIYELLNSMYDEINDPLVVVDLKESNPVIFDWLETHNLNALIIIVIMLLVAVFNMIAALLIILLEKTQFIGILKSLGMKYSSIQKIFIARSSYIIAKGMLVGNILGLGLCFLQQKTGWLKLNAEGYFLSRIPVYVDWIYIILLNMGVFVVIILLLSIPTRVVSGIRPEKTIRFE